MTVRIEHDRVVRVTSADISKLGSAALVSLEVISVTILHFWPYCEGFIPNEIRNAGMRIDTLGHHGTTDYYDWWPPLHEDELSQVSEQSFIHLVSEGTRYIRSLANHEPSISNYFFRESAIRRKQGSKVVCAESSNGRSNKLASAPNGSKMRSQAVRVAISSVTA